MYEVLLILHFLGLALGVGTSFAMFRLGLATRDMDPEARLAFMQRASALGKNGSYGLLILIVSGLAMMFFRGVRETFAWGGGMFHAKLTLVVILMGVFGALQVQQKRALQSGGAAALPKLAVLGRVMLLLGIGTVVFAVLAFH